MTNNRLHHRKPERDVRYETAVHHIDVDQVGVPVDHPDVRLQIEEIAGLIAAAIEARQN